MQIFTVSQVAHYLNQTLEYDAALSDLWISGEVSNLKRLPLGHSYFTLKDRTGQLRCVLFRSPAGYERELADGAAAVVHGRVTFYEARGDLQMVVDIVQHEGAGAVEMALKQLKAKLQAEGLFDEGRKRPLPVFPRRIAVVTSPTGAVWHDISTVVARRYRLAELILIPTPVQGDGAVAGIVAAFRALNARTDVDVVIVARGGGSLEELLAFNTEEVARAIYGSRAPVISGVGHETDVTIADWVADHRAATPSAAAELAVPDRMDLLLRVAVAKQRMTGSMADLLERRRVDIAHRTHRLRSLLPRLDRERQRIDDAMHLLSLHLRRRVADSRGVVAVRTGQLDALHPGKTLGRGYALVQHGESGQIVTAPYQVRPGDPLKIAVAGGTIPARADSSSAARTAPRRIAKGRPDSQMPLFS